MTVSPYVAGAVAAVVTGLDRTAALQMLLSRPLVAAALAGLLLGAVETGVMIGALLELLWLSRLPVGASIPHDDTQVAVGATTLAVTVAGDPVLAGVGGTLLCVLVTMPLAKVGQLTERWARQRNNLLQERAHADLAAGNVDRLERLHLLGLVHFALAALLTYGCIVLAGSLLLRLLAPLLLAQATTAAVWIRLALVLVGIGALLRTMNVKHAYWLFGVAYALTYLFLWWLK